MPRQQTLRATVDWSYSLLSGSERSLLRRLSVFVESFDLEAAEEVCCLEDIEKIDVDNLLGSLVDRSLVVTEPSGGKARYRLLETIRQFAAEHLVESDEVEAAAIGAAHALYYLSLAELAAPHLFGPEQGRWYDRLDADQANLQRGTGALDGRTRRDGASAPLRRGAAALLAGARGTKRGGDQASHVRARASGSPSGPEAVRCSPGRRRVRLQRYENGTVGR